MSEQSVSQQGGQADILSWKESSLKSATKNVTTAHSRASKLVSSAGSSSVQKKSTASTHRAATISKQLSVKSVQEAPKIITTVSSFTSRPVTSTITRHQSESFASTSRGTKRTKDVETKTSMIQNTSHRSNSKNNGNSQDTSSTSQSFTAPLSPLMYEDLWHSLSSEFPAVAEYLKEMQVDQKLPEVLNNIFKLKQLPFSPYAQLMCDIRPTMER